MISFKVILFTICICFMIIEKKNVWKCLDNVIGFMKYAQAQRI